MFRNLDRFSNPAPDCLNSVSTELANCDSFEQGFAKIVVSRRIGRTTTNLLLELYRAHNVGNFPKDARSLLGSMRTVSTCDMLPGRYFHFGLTDSVNRSLRFVNIPQGECLLKLQVNIDGLPLSRSSNISFWPILGRVVSPVLSNVFVIGLYVGHKKPNCIQQFLNSFIQDSLKAYIDGISIATDYERHCKQQRNVVQIHHDSMRQTV